MVLSVRQFDPIYHEMSSLQQPTIDISKINKPPAQERVDALRLAFGENASLLNFTDYLQVYGVIKQVLEGTFVPWDTCTNPEYFRDAQDVALLPPSM